MKTTLVLPLRISQGFLGRLTPKSTIKIQLHESCIWGQGASHSLRRRVMGRSWGRMSQKMSQLRNLSDSSSVYLAGSSSNARSSAQIPSWFHLFSNSCSETTASHVPHLCGWPSGLHFPPWLFSQASDFMTCVCASWVAQKREAKMALGDFLGVMPMKDKSGCVIYSLLCNKLPHSYCGSRI